MQHKIELRLALTTHHELHIAPDLLRSQRAVFAANDRFVSELGKYTASSIRPRTVRLHELHYGIHAWGTMA